jgi:hypothetical protein
LVHQEFTKDAEFVVTVRYIPRCTRVLNLGQRATMQNKIKLS